MGENDVHIEKYDWHLRVFYAVTCYHVDEIMLSLKDIDCPELIQNRVQENLMRCDMDTGFTYSNKKLRSTVMVIGLHSSHAEFLNSFEHELRHLVDDIAETFGLDNLRHGTRRKRTGRQNRRPAQGFRDGTASASI